MRELFLACAATTAVAVSDDRVAAAWDAPSALADQTVGMLAGHLGRAVSTVATYLDAPRPESDAIDLDSTAAYLAAISTLDESVHVGVRSRSAAVAAEGPGELAARTRDAVPTLTSRLAAEPSDRRLAVFGGAVMRLDDYLGTRVVEQVVHLDDLARSLEIEPWANPEGADAFVLSVGVEAGLLVHGAPAMLRALFRDGAADVLPVL